MIGQTAEVAIARARLSIICELETRVEGAK